jgi:hypothetical protein
MLLHRRAEKNFLLVDRECESGEALLLPPAPSLLLSSINGSRSQYNLEGNQHDVFVAFLVLFLFLLDTKRDASAQKGRENMKQCEDRSEGGMCIIDNQTHIHLKPHEASAFWQWLSARQQTLHAPDQQTQREMHLSQKDLNHGDEEKTAIADLHEQGPMVRVLDAGGETVTQRAFQLLKAYQIEAHVHPLLEDSTTYAQG